MVNSLRFTKNPTLCPFTMLMSSPWKKSPNVPSRTKNKAWIFVNSFSFNFLEFLAKIYWGNFSPWAKKAKKGRYTKNRTVPAPETGWAGRPRWVPAEVDPGFRPNCSFSTSFFGQKILREVLKRKMKFLGFSSSDFLFGRIGSSGINPFKQYFAPTQQPLCPRGA
jgi:hypothetical protein